MPRKKRAKSEAAKSHYQPARTFAFTLSPPTESDNGDEIVLRLTEDGIQSLWKTWLLDEDLGTAYNPEDMEIILNRGDFTLLTGDSEYYPCDQKATTLAFIDGDEKVCFYKPDEAEK